MSGIQPSILSNQAGKAAPLGPSGVLSGFVKRIELTDRLDGFGRGKGGFWEDRGYEWYAGI